MTSRVARRLAIWIAALALGGEPASAAVAGSSGESRVGYVEVSAFGPLERATLDCGAAGRTELELGLAAGETRRLIVPVPQLRGAQGASAEPLPSPSSDAVRVLARQPDHERESAFGALPAATLARPAPRPAGLRGPRIATLLVVVAAAAFVARFAARRTLALAIGVCGAACVLALELSAGESRGSVVVLDFTLGEAPGVRRESARHELELAGDPPLALAVTPEGLALELDVDARGDSPPRIVARAPGAVLVRVDAVDLRPPEAAANRFGHLGDVWVRAADGRWTFRGDWSFGESLPEASNELRQQQGARSGTSGAAGDSDGLPPLAGWLQAGLPQGVSFLVGRVVEPLAGGAPGERSASGGRPREVWVRVGGL